MEKNKRLVVTRTRRPEEPVQEFNFSADDIRPGLLKDFRLQAWETFNSLPFPTKDEESWRRSDLRSMPVNEFNLPVANAYEGLPAVPVELLQPLNAGNHGGEVILLPGGVQVDLDPLLVKKGVIFTDLRTAEGEHPELIKKLAGQIVKPEAGKFAALAGALSQNGLLLYVPKGVTVEEPLHSLLWEPGLSLAHFSHLLIYVDEGASVTYIHETASPDENGHSMDAGLAEIFVAEGAQLRFSEIQSLGGQVWNFNHARARLAGDSHLEWSLCSLGARFSKRFMDLEMVGQGASARISGLYFIDGGQHADFDTQQNHLAGHTTSDLLFKGALKDHSRAVWQGMIYVAPGAEKADGYQANRNLMLSPEARADSIPGLEILADDVRCTHGATIGRLERDQMFYLNSRGIPPAEAEQLLVEGFFEPVLQQVCHEGFRTRFMQAVRQKMA